MTASVLGDRPVPLNRAARTRLVTGLPPHDVAAEEAVLAALLLDEDAWRELETVVTAEDFFREQNGWIFEACAQLVRRRDAVTIPTVAHELERAGRLDAAGGEPYLAEIAGKYFTAVGAVAHARIVARDAAHRRLITAGSQIAALAYAGGSNVEHNLALARALIDGIRTGEMASSLTLIDELLRAAEDAPLERGVTTGYRALDAIVGGFKRGQLTVVGAFTDGAKTAFLAGSATRTASTGVPVAYLPLEDTSTELSERMVDHAAGVSPSFIRRTAMTPAARAALTAHRRYARGFVQGLPIWMPEDDRLPGDFDGIRAAVAQAARFEAETVYLDHLDALPAARGFGETSASVVAEWMRQLKRMAIEFDVHIVVASQVNREANRAGDVIPRMAYLKESGAKEQQAQNVLMLGLSEDTFGEGFTRRLLQGYVEKVKGFEGSTRYVVSNPDDAPEDHMAALYLDRRAGAVYELGAPLLVEPRPAPAQGELVTGGVS